MSSTGTLLAFLDQLRTDARDPSSLRKEYGGPGRTPQHAAQTPRSATRITVRHRLEGFRASRRAMDRGAALAAGQPGRVRARRLRGAVRSAATRVPVARWRSFRRPTGATSTVWRARCCPRTLVCESTVPRTRSPRRPRRCRSRSRPRSSSAASAGRCVAATTTSTSRGDRQVFPATRSCSTRPCDSSPRAELSVEVASPGGHRAIRPRPSHRRLPGVPGRSQLLGRERISRVGTLDGMAHAIRRVGTLGHPAQPRSPQRIALIARRRCGQRGGPAAR